MKGLTDFLPWTCPLAGRLVDSTAYGPFPPWGAGARMRLGGVAALS